MDISKILEKRLASTARIKCFFCLEVYRINTFIAARILDADLVVFTRILSVMRENR